MTVIIYVIIENIHKLEEGTMTRVSASLSLTTAEAWFLQSPIDTSGETSSAQAGDAERVGVLWVCWS
jgi:hypothetical protein